MENLINAKVVYKDLDNDNKIVYYKDVSGQPGQPVNLKYYKRHVPSKYQFEGYGHVDRYLKNGGVSIIYVKERRDASAAKKTNDAPKGKIMIDYINSNNQLVGHKTITGTVGHSFGSDQYKKAVPKGFKFDRILTGGNIANFKAESQIMVIQASKIKHAKVVVKYVDHRNKLIGSIETKMTIGKPFDIHRYINTVPSGYKFVKVIGQEPKEVKRNLIINVEVASKAPKQAKSNQKSKDGSNLNVNDDSEKIGSILMKLASSLHDLGLSISKGRKL